MNDEDDGLKFLLRIEGMYSINNNVLRRAGLNSQKDSLIALLNTKIIKRMFYESKPLSLDFIERELFPKRFYSPQMRKLIENTSVYRFVFYSEVTIAKNDLRRYLLSTREEDMYSWIRYAERSLNVCKYHGNAFNLNTKIQQLI